jgi:hypothetical protein
MCSHQITYLQINLLLLSSS